MTFKSCERYGCKDPATHKVVWTDRLGTEEWYFCKKDVEVYISSSKDKNNKIVKIEEIKSNE